MRFKNEGKKRLVRIGTSENADWISVDHLEEVDLQEEIGIHHGFKKIDSFKSDIHNKKEVETKLIDYTPDNLFYDELVNIKGIGKKTAKDIVEWGTKEKLIEVIELKGSLPFRDDVENLLRDKYGN